MKPFGMLTAIGIVAKATVPVRSPGFITYARSMLERNVELCRGLSRMHHHAIIDETDHVWDVSHAALAMPPAMGTLPLAIVQSCLVYATRGVALVTLDTSDTAGWLSAQIVIRHRDYVTECWGMGSDGGWKRAEIGSLKLRPVFVNDDKPKSIDTLALRDELDKLRMRWDRDGKDPLESDEHLELAKRILREGGLVN